MLISYRQVLKKSLWAVPFLGAFSLFSISRSRAWGDSPSPWSLFYINPLGSGRHLGLGGSDTGWSEEVSGLSPNPSSLAYREIQLDFSYYSQKNQDSTNATNQFAGIAFGSKPFIFGLSYCVPLDINLNPYTYAYYSNPSPNGESSNNNSGQTATSSLFPTRLRHSIIDFMVGYKISEMTALGFTYQVNDVKETYLLSSGSEILSKSNPGRWGATFTLVSQDQTYGMGLSYWPSLEIPMDTSYNSTMVEVNNWFRGAYLPQQSDLGFFYDVDKARWFLALKTYRFSENRNFTPFPKLTQGTGNSSPSELNFGGGAFIENSPSSEASSVSVWHLGVDWKILDRSSNQVYWRLGFYKEPQFAEFVERNHTTMGMDFWIGPMILGVAYDWASDYDRTIQGFSFQWKSLKEKL